MSTRPQPKELANIVPLNEVDEALREQMCIYSRVESLSPGELAVTHAADEALYLLKGSVTPHGGDDIPGQPVTAPESFDANHALAPCRRLSAGKDGARLLRVDRGRLGTLLAWTELCVQDGDECFPPSWLPAVLRSELLARLPGINLQTVLALAEPVEIGRGERPVSQGEPGEHYFLIIEGEFAVLRQSESGLPLLIAHLHGGDAFGEEALLTETPRNATVEAETDALCLRLGKADFMQLIGAPLLRTSAVPEARADVAGGARWLDVRTRDEFAHDGLRGALNVPLPELRDARESLSVETRYVTLCDSGRRAACAAFLLSEWGFEAVALAGGLVALLGAGDEEGEQLDLSTLEAELAVTDAALDAALARQAAQLMMEDPDKTDPDPDLHARIAGARAQVEEVVRTKAELETRIRDLQANAARAQAELEAKREHMRASTEARLDEERARLRQEYDRATAAIAALRETKAAATAQVEATKRGLDEGLAQTQARLEREAATIHRELLRTRDSALANEALLRQQQTEGEQALVLDTEERLRVERRRLEAQFAESLAELQTAESRLDALEAERESNKERARSRNDQLAAAQAERQRSLTDKLEAASVDGGPRIDDEALLEVEVAANAEGLRLNLQAEVETLLEEAEADAQRRAAEARRQLEFIADRDRDARERVVAEEVAERGMFADIAAQLDRERAAGEKAYAERLAELTGEAREGSARERKRAEEALSRARAHIARIKKGDGPR